MDAHRFFTKVILSILILMSSTTLATTYYVDPDGDDDANGLSWETAFATIQKGVDTAINGDIVEVNEGTYYESINFNGKAITLQSINPDDWDVTEATIINANGAGRGILISGTNNADSAVKGLTVRNASCGIRVDSRRIGCSEISRCIIKDNQNTGIDVLYAKALISNNKIFNNGVFGIYTADTYAKEIKNNLIYGNGLVGIYLSDPGTQTVIRNNTIVDNIYNGVQVAEEDDPIGISNCIVWGTNPLDNCTAIYSCIQGGAGGTGNISSDPCFVDAENNDYHLALNSPCINAGDPNGNYSGEVDIDGNPRVCGNRVEIGAYEFAENPTQYTLSITTAGKGAVSPSDQTAYEENTVVVLEANAASGWLFGGWSGDVNESDNPITITMDSDKTILANFLGVHNLNKDKWYSTIQAAIDEAETGNVIEVAGEDGVEDGYYYDEDINFGGKAITLRRAEPVHPGYPPPTIHSVTFNQSEGRDSVIEGLRIAFYSPIGIECDGASPTIRNCEIAGCYYTRRGIYNHSGAAPLIENCIFRYNAGAGLVRYGWDGQIDEAAIYNDGAGAVEIKNCVIYLNNCCAIYNKDCSPAPNITNCLIYFNGYRGIYNENCSPIITNCTIKDNDPSRNCSFHYNLECTEIDDSENDFDHVSGCSLQNVNASPTVTNCIFWNSDAWWYTQGGMLQKGEPRGNTIINQGTSDPSITYSCIQGDYEGEGNIDRDPLFANVPYDDWYYANETRYYVVPWCEDSHEPYYEFYYIQTSPLEIINVELETKMFLRSNSPCIDSGKVDVAPLADIFGVERDTGTANMGAFEYNAGPLTLISAGYNHNLLGKRDYYGDLVYSHSIWGCGANNDGILGVGTGAGDMVWTPQRILQGAKNYPVDDTYLEGIIGISAGYAHSLAVGTDGSVWAWGKNTRGEIGVGGSPNPYDPDIYSTPVRVKNTDGSRFLSNITKVSTGGIHYYGYSLALDESGNVWAWGCNQYTTFSSAGSSCKCVQDCGEHCSSANCNNMGFGQLGIGNCCKVIVVPDVIEYCGVTTPHRVSGGEMGTDYLEGVVDICAAITHSIACDLAGNVWTWGYNFFGELGNGEHFNMTGEYLERWQTTPVQVVGGEMGTAYLENIVAVAASGEMMAVDWAGNTSYALSSLSSGGNVWAWGSGIDGKLGNGSSSGFSPTPVKVHDGEQTPDETDYLENIVAISAGYSHVLALDKDGFVWAWGTTSSYPTLGNGSGSSTTPVKVQKDAAFGGGDLSGIVVIEAGCNGSMAVDKDDNVWVWGNWGMGTGYGSYIEKPIKLEF